MKSKPLEIYERIDDFCCLNVNRSENPFEGTEYKNVDDLVNDLEALKKYLTAFSIIEEKRVDVDLLIDCFKFDKYKCTNGLIEYNDSTNIDQKELTKEEYDLLKEVHNLLKGVLLWKDTLRKNKMVLM